MPYTHDPANNPIDRIRLNVGDIWEDMEMLADADYQYFLDAANGNENRATMDAARAILFKLTRMTRERTGDIEVYGGDWFSNYMKALQLILKNPDISISLAVPYAGGISRSDMQANRCDPDNFRIGIGMYKIDRRNAILEGNCEGACNGLYF
ncbi:hypothetical protein uav_110 [Pseudomonas phage UAVern]|uniref:Uncharacterized protein n=1 Tax=Pseudomonas phage UAVern TaxID=2856997 RepID=A0A975YYN3_9CAUD|nr:hypothetical protein uav_110 [Pseudomonas phage UAVern]